MPIVLHARFIDSLTIVYFANDASVFNNNIQRLFGEQSKFVKTDMELFGYQFSAEIQKGRRYPITLVSEEGVDIRATLTHPSTNPSMEIKLCHPLIWNGCAIKTMQSIAKAISKELGEGDFVVQRCDLCIHVSGYDFTHDDRSNFTGNFRDKTTYYAAHSKRNDVLTGFKFGTPKGKTLYFKIYNKTLEIRERKSWDPSPYYSVPLTDRDVWCLEATFEQSRLREFNIDSLESLEVKLPSLWKYSTSEYIQLKEEKSNDSKISRRPASEMWSYVQNAWGEEGIELKIPEKDIGLLLITKNKANMRKNLINLGKKLRLITAEALFEEISKTITDNDLAQKKK